MVPRRVDRPGWSPSSRRLTAVTSLWLLCCSVATPSVYAATGSGGAGPTLTAIDAIRALAPQVANERHRVRSAERSPTSTTRAGGYYCSRRTRRGCSCTMAAHISSRTRNRAASRRRRRGRRPYDGKGFAPGRCAGTRSPDRPLERCPARSSVAYAALLSGVFDCEVHPGGRCGAAGLAVGVGQDAVCRHRRRRRRGASLVLGLFAEDLTRFIDARVRLLGNAGTLYNQSRQVRGVSLFAGRAADAVVETSAPDPWSLPVRAISSLYTHQAMDKLDRRVRLRGTVTATGLGSPHSSRTSRCTRVPARSATGSTSATRPARR